MNVYTTKTTLLLGNQYLVALLQAIQAATFEINILSYNWSLKEWERNNSISILTREIIKASGRGVKVRAICNGENQKHPIMIANMRTVKRLRASHIDVKITRVTQIMHAKAIIIDGRLCFTGSHNLSCRSVTSNDEVSVLTESRELANEINKYFQLIWERQ